MCVSRVVLSANNCCGRRPKGARRAVPRLPSRDTNFRWAPMTWGSPASSQQGRRCRRHDAFCPASSTGCTSTSIMHQTSAARGRDATTTLGISRRVWRCQNSVVVVEGVARPGFPGVPDLVDVTIFCGRQDSSLAVSTSLRPKCSISWPAGLQHWPTAFWVSFVSQVLSRYFFQLHVYW